MNSHVQQQRQEGSELRSSAFWLPLYLLLFDLPADQTRSYCMRLHGNYAAPSMANCSNAWEYYLPSEEEIQH